MNSPFKKNYFNEISSTVTFLLRLLDYMTACDGPKSDLYCQPCFKKKFHISGKSLQTNIYTLAWEPRVAHWVIVSPTNYPRFAVNYDYNYLPDKSRSTQLKISKPSL